MRILFVILIEGKISLKVNLNLKLIWNKLKAGARVPEILMGRYSSGIIKKWKNMIIIIVLECILIKSNLLKIEFLFNIWKNNKFI